MNIIEALTKLLFKPDEGVRRGQSEEIVHETRNGFARGGVAYKNRQTQTLEELEAERVAFRKSLARTDY